MSGATSRFRFEMVCNEQEIRTQKVICENTIGAERRNEEKRLIRMQFCYDYRNIVNINDMLSSGQFLVNDKFVYSPNTGKWKIKGKSKYYTSKSPDQFINKYVLQENNKKEIKMKEQENSEIKYEKRFNTLTELHGVLQDEYEELHYLNMANEKTINVLCQLRDIKEKKRVSILWGLISF